MKNRTVKTTITKIDQGKIFIRGREINQLIGYYTFSEVVYLLFSGQLPTTNQRKMLDAILVSCIDHGVNTPSTHVARTVASCGVPIQSAVAAGISAIGAYHGGAGEECARILQEGLLEKGSVGLKRAADLIVSRYLAQNQRLPGFGHRIHDPDPRAISLFNLANELGLSGDHIQLIKLLEQKLRKATGKALSINVDGAVAAILSDLGWDWRSAKSIFLLSRTAGLTVHVEEQMRTGKPLQFAPPVDVSYGFDYPQDE